MSKRKGSCNVLTNYFSKKIELVTSELQNEASTSKCLYGNVEEIKDKNLILIKDLYIYCYFDQRVSDELKY